MIFAEKYRHIGYSNPSVPNGWKSIVEIAIIDIEKEMWSRYIPFFIKRFIHYLATGNSVYYIKYRWAHKLRTFLTRGMMVRDIKEKYATLRIYADCNDKIDKIIEIAEKRCDETCQDCGGNDDVQTINLGWYYNLCKDCRKKKNDERQIRST